MNTRPEPIGEPKQKRKSAAAAPAAPAPQPSPEPQGETAAADIGPNRDTPIAAVQACSDLIAQYGTAAIIRALDIALRNGPQIHAAAIDVAEGVRMTRMRRRASQ